VRVVDDSDRITAVACCVDGCVTKTMRPIWRLFEAGAQQTDVTQTNSTPEVRLVIRFRAIPGVETGANYRGRVVSRVELETTLSGTQ
jgi:hypothetical protein